MKGNICKFCSKRAGKRLQEHEQLCIENPENTQLFLDYIVECIINNNIKGFNRINISLWLKENINTHIEVILRQVDNISWKEWLKYICELQCNRILENNDEEHYYQVEIIWYWFNSTNINLTIDNCTDLIYEVFDLAYKDATTHFLSVQSHRNKYFKEHVDAVLFLHAFNAFPDDYVMLFPLEIYEKLAEKMDMYEPSKGHPSISMLK